MKKVWKSSADTLQLAAGWLKDHLVIGESRPGTRLAQHVPQRWEKHLRPLVPVSASATLFPSSFSPSLPIAVMAPSTNSGLSQLPRPGFPADPAVIGHPFGIPGMGQQNGEASDKEKEDERNKGPQRSASARRSSTDAAGLQNGVRRGQSASGIAS